MRSTYRRGEAGELSFGLILGVVVLAGILAAVPLVLLGRGSAERTEAGLQVVEQAKDVQAESAVTNAIRASQVYFAERGTFVGFTASVAMGQDPSIAYNDAGSVPGQVSIRGVTPTTVVLVYPSASGATLCAAASGTTLTYGRQDASIAAGCTGDW
jgi:hypothetical protein